VIGDVAPINGATVGWYTPALSSRGTTNGNEFRSFGHGRYLFGMSTRRMAPGGWNLRVTLKDGTQYTTAISLR
jgi:hypothetical protein